MNQIKMGDIGYEISPYHWGQGFATEAAREIVAFGFTNLGLHRIGSRTIADNHGSARVLAKLEMQFEGRLCENEFYKGHWWDTLVFGLLKDEWQNIMGLSE